MQYTVDAGIFGRRLSDTLRLEGEAKEEQGGCRVPQREGCRVPQIVDVCVEFLRKYGLETEGLFRLVSSATHTDQSHCLLPMIFVSAMFN